MLHSDLTPNAHADTDTDTSPLLVGSVSCRPRSGVGDVAVDTSVCSGDRAEVSHSLAAEFMDERSSWKPVRVAAAHALHRLIVERFPKSALRLVLHRVVNAMMQVRRKVLCDPTHR